MTAIDEQRLKSLRDKLVLVLEEIDDLRDIQTDVENEIAEIEARLLAEGSTTFSVRVQTTSQTGLNVRSYPWGPILGVFPYRSEDGWISPADRSKLGQRDVWVKIRIPSLSLEGMTAAWLLEEVSAGDSFSIGHALTGVHGPADPSDWAWNADAYDLIRRGKFDAVKLLTGGGVGQTQVNLLKGLGVLQFLMARVFHQFWSDRKWTPLQFVTENEQSIGELYRAGIRWFEVNNEPNLGGTSPEGYLVQWNNGIEYGQWLAVTVRLLKTRFPEAKWCWPGLSPGFDIPNFRYNSREFLREAKMTGVFDLLDGVCMHTYWGNTAQPFETSIREVRDYCAEFPNKPIFVTEFSNPSPNTPGIRKAEEYQRWFEEMKKMPSNLVASFLFVLSASSGFSHEVVTPEMADWIGENKA